MWYLSFSVWLTSLSMIISRSGLSCCKWHYSSGHGWATFSSLHFTYTHIYIYVYKYMCIYIYICNSAMKYFWDELLPLDCKKVKPANPKGNQSWRYSNTLATWCEELTSLKRPWCWEKLKAGREGDNRGWCGWMAPLTQWTWVWVNSRRWRRIGKPGVLQSMGSQRVGHDWATELNWSSPLWLSYQFHTIGI